MIGFRRGVEGLTLRSTPGKKGLSRRFTAENAEIAEKDKRGI
jgi:hypothetical protein